MKIEDERIIIETVEEGNIVAAAGEIGLIHLTKLTDIYKDIDPEKLPLKLGRWATIDVINGFRHVKNSDTISNNLEILDSEKAGHYLNILDQNL